MRILALYTAAVVLHLVIFFLVYLRFGEIGVSVAIFVVPVTSLLVARLLRDRSGQTD